MSSAMALRLDDQMRRRIARLAARRGTTRSALVREAIAALVEKESGRRRSGRTTSSRISSAPSMEAIQAAPPMWEKRCDGC
jgi:metal-responsive CopG/Arc/MetJ family transcriptional regulator